MDFTGIPKPGFVLSKPIVPESYKIEVVKKLDREGRLIKTRKRDGWKMFSGIDSKGKVRLFTDGLNEIDDRLAHIKREQETLGLRNALLVGEALIDADDNDDFAKVGGIMHSGYEKALTAQICHGFIRHMLFNIVFLDGKPFDAGYEDVLAKIQALLAKKRLQHTFRVPILDCPLAEAQRIVREKKWEGLVLYDKDFRITYRTDGKSPARPKGCYKWKPIDEDDFIVRECILRDNGTEVKELVLLQKDPTTGEEFRCGRLGSFTNEKRREFADPSIYPFVVQAAFETRFEKTGKIRNARFMHPRPDKRIEDCIAPRSYPEAKWQKTTA